jgi:hypothetical protein
MKTYTVAACGWCANGTSMGTMVEKGILSKQYGSNDEIIWTNISEDCIVTNEYETLRPGESVIWEK